MNEKYILSTKTYEDWRNYLIVNSFFFEVLARELRKQLDIPFNGLGSVTKIIDWEQKNLNHRKRKVGEPRHHVYYHCTKQINYECPEPYVKEEELTKAILRYINFMEMDQ